jgi:hypothetical protein
LIAGVLSDSGLLGYLDILARAELPALIESLDGQAP